MVIDICEAHDNKTDYTTFQDLPVILCADEVAKALRISRANAYNLMRSEGFPTLKIGKRMSVPKEKLIEWIEANTAA